MQQSCAETESVNSGGGNRNGIYRAFLALQLQEPSTTVNHIHTLLYSINITHFVYVTSLANLEPPIYFKKKRIYLNCGRKLENPQRNLHRARRNM